MLQIVPLPVAEMLSQPSPKNSTIWLVPPFTVRIPISFRMTSLDEVHPDILPVNLTPIMPGQTRLKAWPVMTSTASAPPTPIASMPKPPPLGVWESVPSIMPPGKA